MDQVEARAALASIRDQVGRAEATTHGEADRILTDAEVEIGARDIFTERGISREVKEARGYRAYRKGDTAAMLVAAPEYEAHPDFVGRKVAQANGWVMPKYPVLDDVPPIHAQFRPDWPIIVDRTGKASKCRDTNCPCGGTGGAHTPLDGHSHEALLGSRDRHVTGKFHNNKALLEQYPGVRIGDDVGPHEHVRAAKYLLPPGDRERGVGAQFDPDWDQPPADLEELLSLDPSKPREPTLADYYQHRSQRLDRNPLTSFDGDQRVMFGIEGTPKNDAMVSVGEIALNVPSVAKWLAPELDMFIERFLVDRLVFIVCDSDWQDNSEVSYHAHKCASYLAKRGVRAHVCAPPGAPGKKVGADDAIGMGILPNEWIVAEREIDWARFTAWQSQYQQAAAGRKGAHVQTEVELARTLIRLSDRDGVLVHDPMGLADWFHVDRTTIWRRMKRLQGVGALWEIEGDIDDWRERRFITPWNKPPRYTGSGYRKIAVRHQLCPQLRWVPGPQLTVGDVCQLAAHLYR